VADTKLHKFLKQAAQDPRAWDAFENDPDGAMTAAGLSKSDQAAIKSRKPERIRKALGAGARAFIIVIIGFKK
jgi:hypothetical protein